MPSEGVNVMVVKVTLEQKNRIYQKVRGVRTGDWVEYVDFLCAIFYSEGYRRIGQKGLTLSPRVYQENINCEVRTAEQAYEYGKKVQLEHLKGAIEE